MSTLSTVEASALIASMSYPVAGAAPSAEPPVSIMALHGLGKEMWEGIDAQAYVSELRQEWE